MEKIIKTKKQRKGITLVSLVITIIVLLILAGITINLIIGEDGIIRRAQEAGKNYIDAAENEKLQLGVFTNQMDNIISGSTNNGRTPYNSEFRKNVVEAIKNAGVVTTENDTDETIVANIGKILKEATKEATATADNISEGKTAWINGELITGNGSDNSASYTNGYNDGVQNFDEKIQSITKSFTITVGNTSLSPSVSVDGVFDHVIGITNVGGSIKDTGDYRGYHFNSATFNSSNNTITFNYVNWGAAHGSWSVWANATIIGYND